jgi:hypothetical protein
MAYGQITCIVNRTDRNLSYTKNGEQHTLTPGENHIPASHVRFALTQNVLMGSENPKNPMQFISLVGVKGHKKYACSKIVFVRQNGKHVALFEDGTTATLRVERLDRSKLPKNAQGAVEEDAFYVPSRYELGPLANDERVESGFTASTAGE